MPRFSVLLPTYEHAATLPYAVRSVQAQRVEDLEILICGDGVSEEVRAVILELQHADSRIRFFDLPKAPARGELNRDHVIRQAKGEFILHQNDDDLWLPGHIAMLDEALADADFVGSMQVNVGPDGKVRAYFFDIGRREYVKPWLAWKSNNFGSWSCGGFSPIFAAHRLDAYLRLPEGWVTTPHGLPADQIMWHRFLNQPWCRAKSLCWPIALQFPTVYRQEWTPAQRAAELHRWTKIIEAPDYAVRLWRDILPDLGDRLLSQALEETRSRSGADETHKAALAVERDQRTAAEAVSAEERAQRGAAEITLEEERIRRNAAESAAAEEQAARTAAEITLAEERIRRNAAESAMADERSLRLAAESASAEERAARLAAETVSAEERQQHGATIAAFEAMLSDEQTQRLRAEAERDAILASSSWRLTGPLRRFVDRLRTS